jgi:mono/diheme cytochrome c family protein
MKSSLVLAALSLVFVSAAHAAGPEVTPALLEQGKGVFTVNCVPCHGEKGDGTGVAAAALNPKPRNFTTEPFKNGNTPQAIFDTTTKGLPNTVMAPFGHLPEADRWAVAHYIAKTFVKPAKPAKPAKKGK